MSTTWYETNSYSNDISELEVLSETPKTLMIGRKSLPRRKLKDGHTHRTREEAMAFLLNRAQKRVEHARETLTVRSAELAKLQEMMQ